MVSGSEVSHVFGWMSIACWIIVYSPQIAENYQLQSGEGLSVMFVVIWLLGDLASLSGAIIAGLLPTVIILALYYAICDIILLVQIYYYRHKRSKTTDPTTGPSESTPLLISETAEVHTINEGKLPNALQSIIANRATQYVAAALFVVGFGFAAWMVDHSGHSEGPRNPLSKPNDTASVISQFLGWSSAILYIGARIPQIIKNVKTQCAGLSLALFVFAVIGNVTYVLSICVISTSKDYLLANSGWIAGSTVTVLLDFVVLFQFFHYQSQASRTTAT